MTMNCYEYGELSIISGKVPQSRWSRDIGKERIQVNFVNEIPDAEVCLCWVNRSGEFKGKLVIKPGKVHFFLFVLSQWHSI